MLSTAYLFCQRCIKLGVFSFAIIGSAQAAFMDRVLVIVNEDVITQAEFDYRLQSVVADLQRDNKAIPPELPGQLLDGMITDKLQVQEAADRGIGIEDDELQNALTLFAGQRNLTVEELKASIVQANQPYEMFEASVRDSLIIQRFTEFYTQRRVTVPLYEIETEMKANNLDQDNSEYQIAHIMIKDASDSNDVAQRVREEIAQGLSFQQAVLTYSEATDAQSGGIIGWRTADQLPSAFVDAVKDLQVGDVSPVINGGSALHILKLLDRKGDVAEIIQSKVRHILISAESDVARSQASKRLHDIRKRINDGEKFEDLARIFSDDSVSAALGGSLDWVSPGQMVKPFEETFEVLPLGEISEPVETQFGVHIMVVEDRRKKNVTDDIKRRRVENFLRRKRADREYGQWVSELREGAYIERVAEPLISTGL